MTWSSSGSSEKCGILLAHSTSVKSCLSAAWQIFVTGSLGCRETRDTQTKIWKLEIQVVHHMNRCHIFVLVCLSVCLGLRCQVAPSNLMNSHTHTQADMSTTLWIISFKEEREERQNKQWFCPRSWRKYLPRAAGEKTTFASLALSLGAFEPSHRSACGTASGAREAPPEPSPQNKLLGAQTGLLPEQAFSDHSYLHTVMLTIMTVYLFSKSCKWD